MTAEVDIFLLNSFAFLATTFKQITPIGALAHLGPVLFRDKIMPFPDFPVGKQVTQASRKLMLENYFLRKIK